MPTREEAIEILKDGELNPCVTEDREACNMAIKVLGQQPCEDTISRQAAIDAKMEFLNPNVKRDTKEQTEHGRVFAEGWNACNSHWIKEMENLPSAQPEIIRCKDCKKREHCRTTNTWAVAPSDDWFCADAERRTDE